MDAYKSKEDASQSFRTSLFLILFLLFVLSSSGNSDDRTLSFARSDSQNELVSEDLSCQRNAIISFTVNVPDLQKSFIYGFRNTSYNPLSFLNKISEYNRRIAQKIILIQKSNLAIEPYPHSRIYYYLLSNEDDNPPHLS